MSTIQWNTYAKEYDLFCLNNHEYQKLITITSQIISKLNLPQNPKICELGSGTGNFTIEVLSKIFKNEEVLSLENEKMFFDYQKKKIENEKIENIQLILKDIRDKNFLSNKKQDLFLMIHVLNFFSKEDRNKIMTNIISSMNSGGYLIISDIGRQIELNDWLDEVYTEIISKQGFQKAIDFHNNTNNARSANITAIEKQKNGESYMHTLDEFIEYIESYGLKVIYSRDDLYRKIDDFIIAQKK
jgi:phospholipid N-methyltransferase